MRMLNKLKCKNSKLRKIASIIVQISLITIVIALIPGVQTCQSESKKSGKKVMQKRTIASYSGSGLMLKAEDLTIEEPVKCAVCLKHGVNSDVYQDVTFTTQKPDAFKDSTGRQHDHSVHKKITVFYCSGPHFWKKETTSDHCWCGWNSNSKLSNYTTNIENEKGETIALR